MKTNNFADSAKTNPIKPNFKPSAWDSEPVEPLIHRAKPKFLSKAPKS